MKVIDVSKGNFDVRRIETVADLFADGPVALVENVTLKKLNMLKCEGERVFNRYAGAPTGNGVAGLLEDGRILVLNLRLSSFVDTFASYEEITVASFLLTPR
jgi:hypothetical protein